MSTQRSFVRAVEYWVPDGGQLRWGGGHYGALSAFEEQSRRTRFEPRQGLPGYVWAARRPQILVPLGAQFVRSAAAAEAGIDAALGIPLLRDGKCTAVVVLLCGSREHTGGCLELWEDDGLAELKLVESYYGVLEGFGGLSRLLRFPPGRGLPGLTWQQQRPQLMAEIGNSSTFMRAAAAREFGVEAGLGIPVSCPGQPDRVLVLLSARATPLARGFETYELNTFGKLARAQAYSVDPGLSLSPLGDRVQAAIEEAVSAGLPGVVASGDSAVLCMPLFGPSGVPSAVTLWL